MDLGKYIDDQLTRIRQITTTYNNKAEEVKKHQAREWVEVYGMPVHLSVEQIADNIAIGREAIGKLFEERDAEVEKVIKETEEKLAEEKKKAIQDYAAAEPVPTDEQLRRVEQLRSEYGVGESMILATFIQDMDFHVINETVYAYPYYLLAKSAMDKSPESQRKIQETYIKIFPKLAEKDTALKSIEDFINVFRSQVILFKFNTKGEQLSNLDSIRMKRELYEMGKINQLVQ